MGLFIKIIDKNSLLREVEGWSFLGQYYRVEKLLGSFTFANKGFVVYRYDLKISRGKGLMLDVIYNEKGAIEDYFHVYKNIIEAERCNAKKCAINIEKKYYHNRIQARLIPWYLLEGEESYEAVRELKKYVVKIDQELFGSRYCLCVPAQNDLSDMNLTAEGILLDYSEGGYISVEAELASFLITFVIYGGLFGPVYHRQAYIDHPKVLEMVDTFEVCGGSVRQIINKKRRGIALFYVTEYVSNFSSDIDIKFFRQCLILRLLTIRNIYTMDISHIKIILGWLREFDKIQNSSDVVKMIKETKYVKN